MTPTRVVLAAAVVAIAALAATSDAGQTACGGAAELRTYYERFVFDLNPTRCDNGTGPCTQTLKGWLFVPPRAKRPAIGAPPILIYNHGSGDMRDTLGVNCSVGEEFAGRGYVVFAPHRRGHGFSTGLYFDERCKGADDRAQCKMDYLKMQVDDVREAIRYVKSLKIQRGTQEVQEPPVFTEIGPIVKPVKPNLIDLADRTRLAIMGASFGGITAVFANVHDLGQQAVVDIAGGSQSWEGNETWEDGQATRDAMHQAVRKAVAPVFFLEPMNDKSIEPTFKLAWTAANACRQFQAAIYGPVNATDGDDVIDDADYETDPNPDDEETIGRDVAHGRFVSRHVKTWAPAAHEFMTRYFESPAAPFDHKCQGTSIVPDPR